MMQLSQISPFKYQHPLKHLQLNELPEELFPQPMKKFNYNIQELNKLKKDLQQNNDSNGNFMYQSLENNHKNPLIDLNVHKVNKQYRSNSKPNERNEVSFQVLKQQNTQKSHILAKTKYLFKLQTESSQIAQNQVLKGKNFQISFYDDRAVRTPDNEDDLEFVYIKNKPKNLPQNLHEQSVQFFQDTFQFTQKKKIVTEKMRNKLYHFYRDASKNYTSQEKFISEQLQKYKRQRNSESQQLNQNKQPNGLEKIILEDKQKRSISLLGDGPRVSRVFQMTEIRKKTQSMPKQNKYVLEEPDVVQKIRTKELKTNKHHRLIGVLNMKTKKLFDQWENFNVEQQQFINGSKIKEKQLRILRGQKNFNIETQNRLREEFLNILKVHQQSSSQTNGFNK